MFNWRVSHTTGPEHILMSFSCSINKWHQIKNRVLNMQYRHFSGGGGGGAYQGLKGK